MAVLVVGIWTATLFPLLSVAAANARLVEAFSTDEAIQVNLLIRALHQHSWAINFGAYPHLYLNLALVPLKAVWPSTERMIVLTMRGLSLASAAGLLLFTFGWARRAYGSLTAWLALATLALNPTIYSWAVFVHPDMLQALCLMAALFWTVAAAERPSTARILAASALAGLAFAAKYSGLFVLPLIAAAVVRRQEIKSEHGAHVRITIVRGLTAIAGVVIVLAALAIDGTWLIKHLTADGRVDVPLPMSLDAALWVLRGAGAALVVAAATPFTWKQLERRTAIETVVWGLLLTFAAFAGMFFLASPYSFDHLAFLKGLYYEAVETGAAMNFNWLQTWTNGVFSTIGGTMIVALGSAVVCWFVDRRRRTALEVTLAGWSVIYIVVLLAPVHELALHYAIPLLAPAAILAARGITSVLDVAAWRLPSIPRPAAAAVAILIVAVSESSNVAALAQKNQAVLQHETAPAVVAGQWLEDHVPPTSHIVYHYLSYVPPSFRNVTGTWGDTREWLASANPDVVVVNREVSSGWRGPQHEESFNVCLDRGTCGYTRVFELQPIAIFEKRHEAAAADPRSKLLPALD